jgi:hypothetical protein
MTAKEFSRKNTANAGLTESPPQSSNPDRPIRFALIMAAKARASKKTTDLLLSA